ncbi:MAG TPA: hypothetical protein VF637_03070 [Sphingomicrobium sp.]
MRKIVFVAALLGASAGARAEDMDWRTEAAQTAIHSGLATASEMCASFGFTRVKLQPDAVMRGKIAAHLLGAAASRDELNRWVEVVMAANQLRVGGDDPARLDRGLEALSATYRDPAAFEPARQRFVDNAMEPIRAAINACTRGAAEPFIGKNYFTGQPHGDMRRYEDMFRAQFADTLKKMTQHATEAAARTKGAKR